MSSGLTLNHTFGVNEYTPNSWHSFWSHDLLFSHSFGWQMKVARVGSSSGQ